MCAQDPAVLHPPPLLPSTSWSQFLPISTKRCPRRSCIFPWCSASQSRSSSPAPLRSSSPHTHPSTAHPWLSPGPPEMPGLHASLTSCLLLSQMFSSPQLPGDHFLAAQTLDGGFQWFLLGALCSFLSVGSIATPHWVSPNLVPPHLN